VRNEEAVALRDKGFKDEAKQLLEANCAYLEKNAVELDAPMLMRRAHDNSQQSQSLEGEQWKKARKAMREQQVQDAQLQNPTPKKK
jgi:hypothetical protein